MSENLYVGVDLGGTTIKIGICDQTGKLLHTFEGPTGSESGVETVIDNIDRYVRQMTAEAGADWEQIAGIGAGIPGFMDMKNGIVKLAPNLKWKDVPIQQRLEEKIGKPVRINNDANVAALGEAWSGAGKGISDMVCFTLGTGIGGGIIIDGRIYEGAFGMAGELGHIQVVPDLEATQCGCGQMGCVETVSSATGIIRMAVDAVKRGERTALASIEQITAKDVVDAARQSDETAVRIIKRAAFYLGKTMSAVAVILNPERFIIGGGVSRAGDILFDPVREVFQKYTPEATQMNVEIVPAELGNDAGMVGAAGLHIR